MDKNQIIQEIVEKFVEDEKPFTSVDIGNAIKRKTLSMDVRNREVATWLRQNVSNTTVLQDYDTVPISVNNGKHTAILYFPHWSDPEDYNSRDQKALGPDDISDLRKQAGLDTPIDTNNDTKSTDALDNNETDDRYPDSKLDIADLFDDGDQYNPDNGGVRLKRRLASVERLWIPGDITRAIGLKPGDSVDISKVKIHKGTLNSNLKVHHDGRFSIPRKCIGYGTDPIKVILKDDEIFFEKA